MHYCRMIRKQVLAAALLATLSACTGKSNVNITSGAAVQTATRSEPIFYNGQHYTVNYSYNDALKMFDMKVAGTSIAMNAKDKNTATAIAVSALRYFACPDRLSSRLIGEPQFSSAVWSLQARCG